MKKKFDKGSSKNIKNVTNRLFKIYFIIYVEYFVTASWRGLGVCFTRRVSRVYARSGRSHSPSEARAGR